MKPELRRILLAFIFPLFLLFVLYIIRFLESGLDLDFTRWGIYPRTLKGIFGILSHPLVHASWGHLFANSLPLLFLTWCLYYFYRDLGSLILMFVWLVGGLFTFLIGQPGWHVGASGLIYSIAFFLFFSGFIRRHIPLIAVSLLVTFLYGGLVWNMFPVFAAENTSWEGHLSGAFAGILAAIVFRKEGPQKRDPFEDEDENEETKYTDYQENTDEEMDSDSKNPLTESSEKFERERTADTAE